MKFMAIVWFVLLVGFLMLESSTVAMVSIWFAAGSLCALILSLLDAQLWLQVVVFLAVSCALLAALRPFVRKFITPKIVKTNVDSVVGSTGLVTCAIDNLQAKGQVKLGGMEWTARSASGEPIAEDTLITVLKVEGAKVIVAPAEVAEKV